MSFLSRRRGNHAPPLQESGNFPRPSGSGSIYSVEKPASVRRKHINFPSSLNKLAARLTSKSSSTNSARGAPVSNVGSPLAYWRSRSPSPAPSLDIRMPTGLGRRASELGEREEFEEYQEHMMNGRTERKRSISLPAAATQAARWRAANLAEAKRPPLERISPELLSSVFSFASRADILSLAQVSKSFSQPALRALYADLDLRADDDERIEQCIASLASRRPVASYVRSFACRSLPPPEGGTTSLSTVTFAIALTNMDQLQTLTLPHFDLRILCHTTFKLRHLTLLCKNITPEDFHALFAWLGRHPSLVSLSLPSLVLPSLPTSALPLTPVDSGVPSRPHTPRTPDTPSHDSDAPSHASASPFPPAVLPSLRRFDGPVSIAAALVPGRPVERVLLPIQHTLYDGLRPSALMSALASARDTLRTLVIKPASAKIDQRTLERVVMSAGAELGDFIETLEVHWVLDDEILYKLIVGVLARFRRLHSLCMLRDSPPPHPTSPLLEFPMPPASPPLSPAANRRTSIASYSSAFLSVRGVGSGSGNGNGSGPPSARSSAGGDTPFPRVHERAHLALWSKTCPTLRNVLFLSGAEWGIYPNPTEGGLPQFEFAGYTAQ